jgi:hypothetical protein
MAYYNLRRLYDQRNFTAFRISDERSLFYFTIMAGEELTFDAAGPTPYLLGKRAFDTKTPVYRKHAAQAAAGK